MTELISPATGLLLSGFWLFCVVAAGFWSWITQTDVRDTVPFWQTRAGFGYYPTALLAGLVFYFCIFLPSVSSPAAAFATQKVVTPTSVDFPQSTIPAQYSDPCIPGGMVMRGVPLTEEQKRAENAACGN